MPDAARHLAANHVVLGHERHAPAASCPGPTQDRAQLFGNFASVRGISCWDVTPRLRKRGRVAHWSSYEAACLGSQAGAATANAYVHGHVHAFKQPECDLSLQEHVAQKRPRITIQMGIKPRQCYCYRANRIIARHKCCPSSDLTRLKIGCSQVVLFPNCRSPGRPPPNPRHRR